ncbi:MAG: oligosaccharide flippase family protein [Candidatus Omnitrophica bacterium]|nr:oligosaccharide flippase family protein [Candidatus Omnitrophota bacterium]
MKGASPVRHNIIANFAGGAWVSLINLAFVPFFIKFLGVEAYGLIGIYISLTALFAVFDLGLSFTLSRELSRLSVTEDSIQESRDLVKTFEAVYWGVGIFIGLVIVSLSPFIARYWVNPQGISTDTVRITIMIMGLSMAFQWPASLYNAGLMGLQRQVLINVVRVVFTTLQYGGAVLILWFVSPTILTFFFWQLFIGVTNTLVLRASLWKTLPGTRLKAGFSGSLLKKNWRFAAGMTGISALATILTQLDKIILSKMLTLEFFGYYILAFSVANILSQLVSPISLALFPKFSQIVAGGGEESLASLYHKGCQCIAVTVLPIAVTIAVFSKQILFLWLGNPVTVQNTYFLLTFIVIGTAINALVTLPFILQLAHGWTKLSFFKNVIAAILYVPLLIWLARDYGALGATTAWIILNLGYFLFEIPIMHRRLLKREMRAWYLLDVAVPMIIVCVTILLFRMAMPAGLSMNFEFLWIVVTYLFCVFLLAAALSFTRGMIYTLFQL